MYQGVITLACKRKHHARPWTALEISRHHTHGMVLREWCRQLQAGAQAAGHIFLEPTPKGVMLLYLNWSTASLLGSLCPCPSPFGRPPCRSAGAVVQVPASPRPREAGSAPVRSPCLRNPRQQQQRLTFRSLSTSTTTTAVSKRHALAFNCRRPRLRARVRVRVVSRRAVHGGPVSAPKAGSGAYRQPVHQPPFGYAAAAQP